MQDNNQSQFSTLVKDLYSKYSPEKVDKLDDETLSNIEKTYNGDYKTFVSDYYKKNRPDKVDQLNDETYANIAKTYGFGQTQQSGGAGKGQEVDNSHLYEELKSKRESLSKKLSDIESSQNFLGRIWMNPKEEKMQHSIELYDKGMSRISASDEGKGFVGGAGDAAKKRNTWMLGAPELATVLELSSVAKKLKNDIKQSNTVFIGYNFPDQFILLIENSI